MLNSSTHGRVETCPLYLDAVPEEVCHGPGGLLPQLLVVQLAEILRMRKTLRHHHQAHCFKLLNKDVDHIFSSRFGSSFFQKNLLKSHILWQFRIHTQK